MKSAIVNFVGLFFKIWGHQYVIYSKQLSIGKLQLWRFLAIYDYQIIPIDFLWCDVSCFLVLVKTNARTQGLLQWRQRKKTKRTQYCTMFWWQIWHHSCLPLCTDTTLSQLPPFLGSNTRPFRERFYCQLRYIFIGYNLHP